MEFSNKTLELLNILVFDASIDVEQIREIENNKSDDKQVDFFIERRSFENVVRKKTIFGYKTFLSGFYSKLSLIGYDRLTVNKAIKKTGFENDFIIKFHFNVQSNLLILKTASFGDLLKIKTDNNFRITLVDIDSSNFGKGKVKGFIGFTQEEWQEEKKKYDL